MGLVTGGAKAKSIGFTWSAAKTGLGSTPTAATINTVVGGTAVQFRWDSKRRVYVRYINDVQQHAADGNLIATPNVIVQFTGGYVNTADIDAAGNPGWFTRSVGSGRVVVFRDGHARQRAVGAEERGIPLDRRGGRESRSRRREPRVRKCGAENR